MITKLSEMRPGQRGVIRKYVKNDLLLKLMEMGCVPGETITLEKIAPMGDPISVTVADYHLSLRLNEAENILVELIN
jgi:ferrous iron transport protein A